MIENDSDLYKSVIHHIKVYKGLLFEIYIINDF